MATAPLWAGYQLQLGNPPGPHRGNHAVGQGADPVEIPFSWISPPMTRKPTVAVTKAQVTQAGGVTAYSSASSALVLQYGANTTLVTLDTDVDADPQNLATFLTSFQSTPRPRQPTVVFNLLNRTAVECQKILDVGLAQRVRLTDTPAGTPPGAINFVVQGIGHVIANDIRQVVWSTAALIGTTTSDPGPWFRIGESSRGGADQVPF